MRYYMKTTAPLYVEAFKEILDQASARHRFFKQIAQGWGFDEIGMQEFSYPTTFYKRCAAEEKQQRGPEIEGFKGGERHHQDGATYFKYTFRRSKHATELRKQYAGAPELPAELQGEHFRSDMATAFCQRFQLPNHVFTGNSIGFALVHLLQGDILVCNLPYRDDNTIEAAPAVIPEGFEEITERAWHAEIDRHNKAVQERRA